MPAWTSDPLDTPQPPEITPKAITPRRDVATNARLSGFSPWVNALATIVAVSLMVAAIVIVANCVVLVYKVEMTNSLARQTLMTLAVAGTLAQISLLSFAFVWEEFQQWRTGAQHPE